MITIDNVQYRNLEEQVKKNMDDIQYILEEEGVLNEFGIKVVGQITSSSQLPDPTTYQGEYGDAYAVGTSAPYTLYIYTRANGTHPTGYWFNIGQFPAPGNIPGPQGPQGIKGDPGTRGSTWTNGTSAPTSTSGYLTNDKYLNTSNGDVYNYTGTTWQLVGSIRGPQGTQGPQGVVGPQGAQGIQGPKGDTGPAGPAFVIAATVANEGQLPDPSTLADNIAYLVGNDTDGYDLYVQLQDTQTWKNIGKIESVEGPQGEQGPQGPQGPQGIQGIQGPTGPQGEGIEKIVDGTLTAKKAEQDADGNVIDTTYAKLSQVVRTDAAQSLTDTEKTIAKDNLVIQTLKNPSASIAKGWYRVAKLVGSRMYAVVLGEGFYYNSPNNTKLILNIGYSTSVITQCGIHPNNFVPNRVRICMRSEGDVFFDVYIPDTSVNNLAIYIEKLYRVNGKPEIETYADWEYLGMDDTVAGYDVTLLDLVSGTNTSGQIYQQGSPVLVGDQSAIFESDGTTVKEATNVKTNINGKAISDIFMTDGTTVKNATNAANAAKVNGKNLYRHIITFNTGTLADVLKAEVYTSLSTPVTDGASFIDLLTTINSDSLRAEGYLDEPTGTMAYYIGQIKRFSSSPTNQYSFDGIVVKNPGPSGAVIGPMGGYIQSYVDDVVQIL